MAEKNVAISADHVDMRIASEDDLAPHSPHKLLAAFVSQRAAFMSAPAPYVLLTSDGATVLINDAFTKTTGYGLDELPDIRAYLEKIRRIPSAEIDHVHQGWIRAHKSIRASSTEVTIWTKWDEMRVWMVHTSDPFLWSDGRSVILHSVFDMTEQKRLEQALRRSQEDMRMRLAELESLYNSAPLGLCMIDRDLRFVRVNSALADINGVPASEHIGRLIFDVAPGLKDQSEPLLRHVLETGEPIQDIEFEGMTESSPGHLRNFIEHIYPLRDEHDCNLGLGIIVEEVTDRRKVENELAGANVALRRTLDLLFLALRTAGVSVFTQDRDLRYIWIGGDYFGCDQDEAIGASDADILPPELVEPMVLLKSRVIETGQAAQADLPFLKDGKTHWCNVHMEPWRSLNGQVQSIIGAVSDISDRKSTEQHIRTLLSELAHRSKNLLTVIQVMARRSVGPELSSEDFVDSFIERLSGLAQSHDLLAREDWRGISMSELITSQIGYLGDEKSARLDIDGPDIVLTPVAAQNLGMAIHELSTNAVKYGALSVNGGQVAIRWSIWKDLEGRPRMKLTWQERGGPPVGAPKRRGFGLFVIEAIAARALGGTVDLRFGPDGVTCMVEGAADSTVLAEPPKVLAATP